jgi:hypothetical protein
LKLQLKKIVIEIITIFYLSRTGNFTQSFLHSPNPF